MPDPSDKHLPTVAVVIPAYNIDTYIVQAIESAIAQTHKADQIIVVDDGSTDDTAERIKQFDSQIQYIYQPNAGLSAARNAGIKAAQTEWIAFLDGDDYWLPEKLKLQLELLQRNSHLVWAAANCYVCHGLDAKKVNQRIPEEIETLLAEKEYFPDYFIDSISGPIGHPNTMIIKRQTLLDVELFREGLAYKEDHDMWWRIAYRWPQIGYVNQPLAVYRIMRPGSITTETSRKEQTRVFCYLIDIHLPLAAKHNRLTEFKKLLAGMLRWWLKILYQERAYTQIRNILKRYGNILPLGYKTNMWLLVTFPRAYSKISRYARTALKYTLQKFT